MEWKTLLSAKRERESQHKQRSSDLRSEFEKDYHRERVLSPASG